MIVASSPKLSGEPTAEALSNGLATLGRYGDNYMVHAAEGETIIPKEILEANPGLKDDLFRQMTMMGVKDPNRYVVGSDLNSINPITGQPEFFFKKLFKAAKKIGKKILPVMAPIIGNMIAPGIGGLVASGLVTKMQGGSWGDAAKSAALAYGVGALGRGIQGGFGATGDTSGFRGFMQGVNKGLAEPWRAAGNLLSRGQANPLAQGIFGPRGTGTLFQGLARTDPTFGEQNKFFGEGTDWQKSVFPSYESTLPELSAAAVSDAAGGTPSSNIKDDIVTHGGTNYYRNPLTKSLQPLAPVTPEAELGPLESMIGAPAAKIVGPAIVPGATAALVYYLSEDEQSTADQLAQLDAANPRRVAFDQWQNIADKDSPEARALKAQWYGQPSYTGTQLASSFGANPLVGITPGTLGSPGGGIATVAAGGEIMGPGTGTSDSIPARLSDGEFVMTAEAVRNAGGGNRALGAARMYDMMNRFERGVA
jgi:hypothetical protein